MTTQATAPNAGSTTEPLEQAPTDPTDVLGLKAVWEEIKDTISELA